MTMAHLTSDTVQSRSVYLLGMRINPNLLAMETCQCCMVWCIRENPSTCFEARNTNTNFEEDRTVSNGSRTRMVLLLLPDVKTSGGFPPEYCQSFPETTGGEILGYISVNSLCHYVHTTGNLFDRITKILGTRYFVVEFSLVAGTFLYCSSPFVLGQFIVTPSSLVWSS